MTFGSVSIVTSSAPGPWWLGIRAFMTATLWTAALVLLDQWYLEVTR